MRELRLRYLINLVSDIGAKSKSDAQALEQAQKRMEEAMARTGRQAGALERVIVRAMGMGGASAERHAERLAKLALRYQDLRKHAEGAHAAMSKAAQLYGGAMAGGMAATAMLQRPTDYDTRLRMATSTAFAGSDVAALRAGREQINALVVDAVRRAPGASRDSTLGAFEKLVGTGSFTYAESAALLPGVMRTSVASGADANDLVQAAEKMKVSLNLLPDQILTALAKVMRAGQEGGFEIKDSAKWIPELLPYMKGYQGMDAVEQLVTMLQQVRSTAGSNDTAANNLRNFLQKMSADSTAKDFDKKYGINLDAEMAKGIAAGQTPVATYMALFDRLIAKADPEGNARKAMATADASTTPEERTRRYEAIKERYAGSAVASIIADLQEFGGYEGLRRTAEYGKKTLEAVRSERGGTVDTGFAFMTEGIGAKAAALANERDIAATSALEAAGPALNGMLEAATKLTQAYPTMTTAVVGATGALGVFTAALGGAGLAGLLTGRAGAGVAGTVVAGGVAAGAKAVGRFAVNGRTLLGGSLLGPLLGAGIDSYQVLTDDQLSGAGKARGLAGAAAGAAGGWAGAAAGAGLGTMVMPGIGTAIGAGLGGLGGYLAGKGAMSWLWGANPARDYLSVTDPRGLELAKAGGGVPATVSLGEGRLSLDVRVSDERTTVNSSVTTPLPLIRLDAGNTNPGLMGPLGVAR